MAEPTQDISELLPHAAPGCAHRRLLVFAMRRMAAGGLHDAHATNAFFTHFGLSFRRPLVLLRALMAEVSRISHERITVAPCCCPRLTAAEAMLIGVVADANDRPREAHGRLCALLGVPNALGALGSAQAVALAFSDCGRPLGR